MIVRVMGEGQYEVGDDLLDRLNTLDQAAMSAIEGGDEPKLDEHLEAMGELVRQEGTKLADGDLRPSEAIIPPSDLTLDETKELLSGEGFIPDPPA